MDKPPYTIPGFAAEGLRQPYDNACHPTVLSLGVMSLGERITPEELMDAADLPPGEAATPNHTYRMERALLDRGYDLEWVYEPAAQLWQERGLSYRDYMQRLGDYVGEHEAVFSWTEADYEAYRSEIEKLRPYKESGRYKTSYDPDIAVRFRPGMLAVGNAVVGAIPSGKSLHSRIVLPAICANGEASQRMAYALWPTQEKIRPMLYEQPTLVRDLMLKAGLLVIRKHEV